MGNMMAASWDLLKVVLTVAPMVEKTVAQMDVL